jgi:hypothetical protein
MDVIGGSLLDQVPLLRLPRTRHLQRNISTPRRRRCRSPIKHSLSRGMSATGLVNLSCPELNLISHLSSLNALCCSRQDYVPKTAASRLGRLDHDTLILYHALKCVVVTIRLSKALNSVLNLLAAPEPRTRQLVPADDVVQPSGSRDILADAYERTCTQLLKHCILRSVGHLPVSLPVSHKLVA